MKKFITIVLVIAVLIIPMSVYAAFSDVPADHWANSYITELSGKGVINGFPDGTFKPSDTLTYGQFIKLIVTASVDGVDFDLVSSDLNHWAAPYVKIAQNYGAVDKDITVEKLDEPISRIEVVRILGICDIDMRRHDQKSVEDLLFTDISDVDIAGKILLSHAVANGIINGYTDGTFKPDNSLTRAEASKILSVYMGIQNSL